MLLRTAAVPRARAVARASWGSPWSDCATIGDSCSPMGATGARGLVARGQCQDCRDDELLGAFHVASSVVGRVGHLPLRCVGGRVGPASIARVSFVHGSESKVPRARFGAVRTGSEVSMIWTARRFWTPRSQAGDCGTMPIPRLQNRCRRRPPGRGLHDWSPASRGDCPCLFVHGSESKVPPHDSRPQTGSKASRRSRVPKARTRVPTARGQGLEDHESNRQICRANVSPSSSPNSASSALTRQDRRPLLERLRPSSNAPCAP